MSRALLVGGVILCGLIAVLFAADLAVALPFARVSPVMDIGATVSGGILAYLFWSLASKAK
ncbi:MAG: hypothetical protein ACKOCN_13170 [Planctomycetaceae bacterium]